MRIYRRDDMELEASREPEQRDERLRELVDELPELEMLAISLMFFGAGSPTLDSVADGMGVSTYRVKEYQRRGFDRIRRAMQEEDGVGPLSAADPPGEPEVFGS